MDVVLRINIQQLPSLRYVVRMEEDALARWVFDAGICESWLRGRSFIRWKDQIEESSIGVPKWKDVLWQAEIR